MDKKRIIIGDKQYTVEIAKTEEDRKKGLQDKRRLFSYRMERLPIYRCSTK